MSIQQRDPIGAFSFADDCIAKLGLGAGDEYSILKSCGIGVVRLFVHFECMTEPRNCPSIILLDTDGHLP